MATEQRATWHKSSQESHSREEVLLEMTEALKEYLGEAREEPTVSFKEWLAISSEAEVILEVKKLREEAHS